MSVGMEKNTQRTEGTIATVDVDQVMSWRPCGRYSREVVQKLFDGRERLSGLDILALDIPAEAYCADPATRAIRPM